MTKRRRINEYEAVNGRIDTYGDGRYEYGTAGQKKNLHGTGRDWREEYRSDRRRMEEYEEKRRKWNRRRVRIQRAKQALAVCFVCMVLLFLSYRLILYIKRERLEVENFSFTESARELRNPNRGFYHLYRFQITEEPEDYGQLVQERYQKDTDTELTLVQISLQAYREGAIGETGLENIRGLFLALGELDKQLVIRFMYDEDGESELYEPESIDIILRHMEQLGPVLREAEKDIFIIQGLFNGNWGEMNGTRYGSAEDMRRLAEKLAGVTDDSTYLSVRMPAQWRGIVGSDNPAEALASHILAGRLSLFNDGILGSESDYGTYLTEDFVGADEYGRWRREEELNFQRELCRTVPNGGEVINENVLNDFANSVRELSAMHVTYLNTDYDEKVLKKWRETRVTEEGCFDGMDGYTYMERHLGYRLLIHDACLKPSEDKKNVYAAVNLKNVGFAPLYKMPKIKLILYSEEEGQLPPMEMSCAIDQLVGGEEKDALQLAGVKIAVDELKRRRYEVYFFMEDPDTGRSILMANEEEEEAYGYRIGTIVVR